MLLRSKLALVAAVFAAGALTMHFIDTARADHAKVQIVEHTKVVVQQDTAAAAAAYEELDNAKAANADLRRQLAAGTKRLYIRAKCTASEPGSMDDETASAELDPAVASDLVGITDEGDEAIRQLNAIQDRLERK